MTVFVKNTINRWPWGGWRCSRWRCWRRCARRPGGRCWRCRCTRCSTRCGPTTSSPLPSAPWSPPSTRREMRFKKVLLAQHKQLCWRDYVKAWRNCGKGQRLYMSIRIQQHPPADIVPAWEIRGSRENKIPCVGGCGLERAAGGAVAGAHAAICRRPGAAQGAAPAQGRAEERARRVPLRPLARAAGHFQLHSEVLLHLSPSPTFLRPLTWEMIAFCMITSLLLARESLLFLHAAKRRSQTAHLPGRYREHAVPETAGARCASGLPGRGWTTWTWRRWTTRASIRSTTRTRTRSPAARCARHATQRTATRSPSSAPSRGPATLNVLTWRSVVEMTFAGWE